MTAVFAVWNNYGFSLASDSNQTSQMDNQNWVDPVEKDIVDFANWFSEQKFASNGSSIESLRGDLEYWFTDLRSLLVEQGESITTSFLEELFYQRHASWRTSLNLFGNSWEMLVKDEESMDDVVSQKYSKIQ